MTKDEAAKIIFYGNCKHTNEYGQETFEPYGPEEDGFYRCTICGLGMYDKQEEPERIN